MSERKKGFLSRREFLLTLAGVTGAAVAGVLIEGMGNSRVSSPVEPTSTQGVITEPVRPIESPTPTARIAEKVEGPSKTDEDLERRMSGKPGLHPSPGASPSPVSSRASIVIPKALPKN